ncbi:MAG: membrane dipeptidase [Pseudomonadota bacterium]
MPHPRLIIDNLQYANWSKNVFQQMNEGGVSAVHVTIAYHEQFRETVHNIEAWNRWFERHPELIFQGFTAEDVRRAQREGKTAIIFGFQNPSPMEDDLGLIEVLHRLGGRFMQLSYNNQSLLATGCYEARDPGITRFGKEAIREMNRVGMVIDMSHSAERSTLEAIEMSNRPIAITHANPDCWHKALRNKSHTVLQALTKAGGMLGFSLYPHHLKDGTDCTLDAFCAMIAECAERYGAQHLGIGSDLCQDQPDSVVTWMRNGRWTKTMDYGEGSATAPGFPPQPHWFKDNRDLEGLWTGLEKTGLTEDEISGIMGENWLQFYGSSFGPDSP